MSDPQQRGGVDRRSVTPGLVVLPNGEAVRPNAVDRISIEPWASFLGQEVERFCVIVHLVGGTRRVVASDLGRDEAQDVGRRCGNVLNEALRGE